MKNKFTLGLVAFAISANAMAQQVQPSNEVQIQGNPPGVSTPKLPYQGCIQEVTPGCMARILCVGEAPLRVKTTSGVMTAKKIAQLKANSEIAAYVKNKAKLQEDYKNLVSTYQASSGAGEENKIQEGDLTELAYGRSAEEYLQGVQVIGGEVNIEQGYAKIYVGQSCKSIDGAKSLSARQQSAGVVSDSGQGNSGSAQVMGGPQLNQGMPQTSRQVPTNDF